MLGVLPRSREKSCHYKKKSNLHHRLRPAGEVTHHFKINESSIRTMVKKEKEICEAVAVATPAGTKILYFLRNNLNHILKTHQIYDQDCPYLQGNNLLSSKVFDNF
uniref:Uncharacterized protein n=1 Tax=Moschus moschiferus TaxID=68415 RepID=A0A8C6E9F9_MOSMO